MLKKSKKKTLFKVLTSIVLTYLTIYLILFFFHGNFYVNSGVDTTTKQGVVKYFNDGINTPYLAKVDEQDNILNVDFKILCTSDLHLQDENSEFTLEVLSRFIDKENPDLVVINGDIIVKREDNVMQEKLKNLMISKNQYFAITLGNHDADEYIGKKYNPFSYYYNLFDCEYLVTYNDDDSIDGYGNCAINIKTSNTTISQTLFFMDTKDNDYSQNQIDWYSNKINEIKLENGGIIVPSIVFSHIQLYEYKTAYNLYKSKSDECTLLYGNKLEKLDGPDETNGFFDKMLECGSTKAYIAGHDHNSDLSFMYKGINLIFDQPLSYQSYTRRSFISNLGYLINHKCDYFNDGVNIIMIRTDSSFDNVPKYAQHEHVFDDLDEYYFINQIVYFKNLK